MKNLLIKNKWEYEITTKQGEYGFRLTIYKNDKVVYSQGGFGSISIAEIEAKDFVLLVEFDIERDNNE